VNDPGRYPAEATIDVEVRYAETDQMGVVHHAVYPIWFELARTRLCEATGYHYADIERLGYRLMVTGLTVDYRSPARYGDTVTVHCRIVRLGSRGLTFGYDLDHDGQRLARGTTTHVWLEAERGRPCRIPDVLSEPFHRLADPESSEKANPGACE